MWDAQPVDGLSCFIRILSPANKPALAIWDQDTQTFTVDIPPVTLGYPYLLVVQWRPEVP
jgi:hypothetical protein